MPKESQATSTTSSVSFFFLRKTWGFSLGSECFSLVPRAPKTRKHIPLESPWKFCDFQGEFTLTVDMYYMPCGLNGAVYFVEMAADGGEAAATKNGGQNRAGAKYGTGYCDAQCPHDMKFMEGKANVSWQLQVFFFRE